MAERDERRIAALAARQRGFVTRQQLLSLGRSRHQVAHAVKTRRLIRVYAGVYAVGHVPARLQDQAFGAMLACGPGAVLSHASAAALWGIVERWEAPFEVIVPTIRRREGIRAHRTAIERKDVRRHHGLRVTSLARTFVDVAPRLTDRALRRAVNDQLRRARLRLSHLADVLGRCPRHPAVPRLRPFLTPADGNPTRSHIEDDFQVFANHHGLPEPQVNVWVAGREADAWYPVERVIVELDSWDYHSDRETFERDREKDAAALALGIETIRLTKRRMRDAPEREAERVLAILAMRRDQSPDHGTQTLTTL